MFRGTYRPALDGLRAVAVLAVVAFHGGVLGAGWAGVDVFFVLSGWLINRQLIDHATRHHSADLVRFWSRRGRRLLPGLGTVLVVVAALSAAGLVTVERRAVLAALTYSTNWVDISRHASYWQAFGDPDPLRHLWSLAVEEQTYLVWPIIVAVIVRCAGVRRVRIAALVVAGVSLTIMIWGSTRGWSADRLYQGTDTRACGFALGAACAGWSIHRHRRVAATVAAVVMVAVSWRGAAQPGFFPVMFLVITVAALVVVLGVAGVSCGPLTSRPLVAVGRWSYGIYLLHWPVMLALPVSWDRWTRTIVTTALSVAVASVSYRLIEMPIRRRVVSPVALVALAAATAAGPLLVAQRGDGNAVGPLPAQLPTGIIAAEESRSSAPLPSDPQQGGPRRQRVLVFGDSTAWSIAYGLAKDATYEVVNEASLGCGPTSATWIRNGSQPPASQSRCPGVDVQAALIRKWAPDAILVHYTQSAEWLTKLGGSWVDATTPAWKRSVEQRLAQIRAAAGSAAVIVAYAPDHGRIRGYPNTGRPQRDAWNAVVDEWAGNRGCVLDNRASYPTPGSPLDRRLRPDLVHIPSPFAKDFVRRSGVVDAVRSCLAGQLATN